MSVQNRAGKRLLLVVLALLSIVLTVALGMPASWLGYLLERQTAGRLSLGDAQGSFWQGSAFIGVAAGSNDPVTPLFAGRFHWCISPLLVLGQVELRLENTESLAAPVTVSGRFNELHVSPGSLALPSERLAGLGAPLNTIGPSGHLQLSWNSLSLAPSAGGLDLRGRLQLELNDMSSRLSPVKPLGNYRLDADLQGNQAQLQLSTVTGPMMLSGEGSVQNGRLQFSGKAWAADAERASLANFLNLLGQHRQDGGRDVIALEFK